MKVGINNNIEALASKVQQNAAQHVQQKQSGTAAEAVQASGRTATQAGVPVTVSNSVRSLDQNAKASSDIDMAKVQAMREAIANGTFSVNAGVIADKLLADASLFLGASRL